MSTPAEKKKLLAGKAAAINKHFGKKVIASADKVKNPYFVRRPTGIMELDIDLAGGFPPGISFISGPDGSGKSHLLYRLMAMHQRIYGERAAIALAAVEAPIDHFFMRKLGVIIAVPDEVIEEKDTWRKERGLPRFTKDEIREFKRQVGTFWDITGATMEQTLQAVLNILEDPVLREGDNQFGIIGIDSLNALIPQAWQDADLDENQQRAAHASCITRFFAHYYPLATSLEGDQLYTSIFFTQQVRSNPQKSSAPAHIAKYLPDYTTIGAYAGKHGKLIDVMLTPGQKKKAAGDDAGKSTKKETVQKTLCWELTKGKAGTHEGKTGEVNFEFNTEDFIDLSRTVLVSGIRKGVLTEQQGLISLVNPDNGVVNEKLSNIPADVFLQQLRDNPEFDMSVRREILASEGIQCRFQ